MEYQKVKTMLVTTSDNLSRFNTKKWIEVHDQSGKVYNINKQMKFKTSMSWPELCDYSDAYVDVKGTITVTHPNKNAYNNKLAFKNNPPFISCITKISNTLVDNAEDVDIVMPMYNLIEYSKHY